MINAIVASVLINKEIVYSIGPSKDSATVVVKLKNLGVATKHIYIPTWSVMEVVVTSWPSSQSLKSVRGFGRTFEMHNIMQLRPGASTSAALAAKDRFGSYKPGNYSLLLTYTDKSVNRAAEKFSWKLRSEVGVFGPVAINLNISKKGTYKFELPKLKKTR